MKHWNALLIFVLLATSSFAQQFPDPVLIRQQHIKKFTVLRCVQDSTTDTVYVWNDTQPFPKTPTDDWSKKYSATDSLYTTTYDSLGRLMTRLRKQRGHCYFDSIGVRNWYNAQGLLMQQRFYSCEKGSVTTCYFYNASGQVVRITHQPAAVVMTSEENFKYDEKGRLVFQEGLNGSEAPPDAEEKSRPMLIYRVTMTYRKDGLLDEVVVDDALGPNTDFEIWLDDHPRGVTRFRYVYE